MSYLTDETIIELLEKVVKKLDRIIEIFETDIPDEYLEELMDESEEEANVVQFPRKGSDGEGG